VTKRCVFFPCLILSLKLLPKYFVKMLELLGSNKLNSLIMYKYSLDFQIICVAETWFIKKNPTRCNNISKFHYSIFIWSSTCFGRHTAHHQEPKTALAASGFLYVGGWRTCRRGTLSGTVCARQRPPTTRPTTSHDWKIRGCQCSFGLLMMGGVSPETCWASDKYGIIQF
jgi:hypothetical protein